MERTSYPSLASASYALALFIFAYFLYFADVQVITLLVAPIKAAYGIDDTTFSLLSAGPPIIAIFAVGLPMATLIDRFNRRNLLAAAIAVWTAMNVASAFAPSFWILFALKVGVAMGGAWYYPTVVSLVADTFAPRHRTAAFTLLQLCGTAGVGLAVLLSGGAIALAHRLAATELPLVGHIEWWQWAFILVSAPAPLGALLLFTIREPRRHISAASAAGSHALRPYFAKNAPVLIAVMLGTAIANVLVYGARAWLPEFFIRVFGESAAEAGTVSGLIMTLGSAFGIGAGGVIAYWLRRRGRLERANLAVVIASYVAPLAILALLPFSATPTIAAIVMGIAFLVFNLHGGPQIDIIQGVVPNEIRGRYVTFVLMVGYLGAFLGPVAVGVLNDRVFGTAEGVRYSLTLTLIAASALAALCWAAYAPAIAKLFRMNGIDSAPLTPSAHPEAEGAT